MPPTSSEVEVCRSRKQGIANNDKGQRTGCPHRVPAPGARAEAGIVLAADLPAGDVDPRAE